MSNMIKVTAMVSVTWTGGNNDKISEHSVPVVANYNSNVLTTEHQRRRALVNLAEQQFRARHKEYGKYGLMFGHCEVSIDGKTYYEIS